jgi:hypothetical protein
VPKLTEANSPVRKQKIRHVLIAKKAYNIVTGVELLPVSNGFTLLPLKESWHDQANMALAQIHCGCYDQLLPLIDDINDPVQLWEAFRDRLDNAPMKLGWTQVLRKFTASRPSPEEMVTQYCTKSITFQMKLIGRTENITDDPMKTHINTTLSNSYETTIQILEQRIAASMAQQCIKTIREYAERTTLTIEIRDASTGVAQYTCGENRGRGSGHGGRDGGRGNGRENRRQTRRGNRRGHRREIGLGNGR